MQTNTSDNRSSTRPLTVAAGHPFFENSEKIQRCLTPKTFGGVRWISKLRK
jgi:hypothetical protein